MIAHIGDRLVLEGTHVGDARRVAVVVALLHDDGSPPYQVRWVGSDRTTVIYPGAQARIERADDPASGKPEMAS
jgi:hypothetical protein